MGDFPWFRDPQRCSNVKDFLSLHERTRPPKCEIKIVEENPATAPSVEPPKDRPPLEATPELISSFNACIDIRERQYQFRTVKNCFIGKEAVAAMIRAGLANDKTQAVEIGNLLMDHDVFRHASKVKQAFKDDYVFYRLTPKAAANAAANPGRIRSLQGPSVQKPSETEEHFPFSLRAGLNPVPVSYKAPSVQDNAKKIKNFCNAANNPTTSLCLQGADLTPAQAIAIADCMRSQRLESLVFSSLCFGTVGDPDSSGGLSALERLLASLIGLYLQSLVLQDLRFHVPLASMPPVIMKQLTGLCSQLNLRSLSLNKCQLDEQSGKAIGTFLTTNVSLTQLDLSYNS